MRTYLIAGNWKMHGSLQRNRELLGALTAESLAADVVVVPPFVYLPQAIELAGDTVAVGAQNVCHQEADGALTGEISAAMLADIGCRYVIVGHSERRQYFGETDAVVAQKAQAALAAGLVPIICVGEREAERNAGQTLAVIDRQLDAVLDDLTATAELVIAYEPVWAIGTGHTATPVQAQEVHAHIRARLAGHDEALAQTTRLLYGGSVKAANAAELFAQPDIDGGLVGGASLDAAEFSAICRAAR